MTEFQAIMASLDVALTGHSLEEVTRQIHHYPKTVGAWWDWPQGGGNGT